MAIRHEEPFVPASSCIDQKLAVQPIKDEALLSGQLDPNNEKYAIGKTARIKLCEALRGQEDFDTISLIVTNLHEPVDNYYSANSHILPALIRHFYDGLQAKDKNVIG